MLPFDKVPAERKAIGDLADPLDDEDGGAKPKKRGGRRVAVECGCQPPRKLHMTPKQIEDGPVICGLCRAPFEAPEADDDEETS
jgi:hypothetical protein